MRNPILLSQYWKNEQFGRASKVFFQIFGAPIFFFSWIAMIQKNNNLILTASCQNYKRIITRKKWSNKLYYKARWWVNHLLVKKKALEYIRSLLSHISISCL